MKTDHLTLGIELGSTNIKAVLLDANLETVATGTHTWENELQNGLWTYSLPAVQNGVRQAFAALAKKVPSHQLTNITAIGISAMMHGYLAFDKSGHLLTPFRTWRNTNTAAAAAALSKTFDTNIPLRWSVAHLYQAILDKEPHTNEIAHLTTLAGYVHWCLTGNSVLGVGDASGVFPINVATGSYDKNLLAKFDALAHQHGFSQPLHTLLPQVLPAGARGGRLAEAGAQWLDPTGTLQPGALVCPPEGDAGTGMVATNSVSPRTGNISVGTSIFAMIVLEHALQSSHPELDIVTTPAGDLVAMVHCNNGSSELAAWMEVFRQFTAALGISVTTDEIYAAVFGAALDGAADGGGLLAYNFLAGEPIVGLEAGRPAVVRSPDSTLSLPNFGRALLYSVFATLALGFRTLRAEEVSIDTLFAHGGLFRTPEAAGHFLAGFVESPIAVAQSAVEGGAWGIAVLAAYAAAVASGDGRTLAAWLDEVVFANTTFDVYDPNPADLRGIEAYLGKYLAGLDIERAAILALE
ncbi:MAG: ATPase [Cellulomonadaceae bacterium]|jgi:sugar (pentulose or hexulose) kinase|nr:ATPase [Cellulomonadaceae bacterium]